MISRDSTFGQSCVLRSNCWAYCPAGTVLGFPMAIFVTLGFSRSENDCKRSWSPGDHKNQSVAREVFSGCPIDQILRLQLVHFFLCRTGETSTGAPRLDLLLHLPEDPNVKVTFVPVRRS